MYGTGRIKNVFSVMRMSILITLPSHVIVYLTSFLNMREVDVCQSLSRNAQECSTSWTKAQIPVNHAIQSVQLVQNQLTTVLPVSMKIELTTNQVARWIPTMSRQRVYAHSVVEDSRWLLMEPVSIVKRHRKIVYLVVTTSSVWCVRNIGR